MVVTYHFLLFAVPKLTSRCTDSNRSGIDLRHRDGTINEHTCDLPLEYLR